MASRKEFEMSFKIDGKTTGAYSTAFKSAQQQLAQMQNELQALNRLQNDISSYQKQQEALQGTRSKLEMLQQQYDNIQQEINETEGFSAALENRLLSKQQQIDKTTATIGKQESSLRQMGAELEKNGVDTANLTDESRRLEAEYKSLQKEQEEAADAFREGGESAGIFGKESVAAVDAVATILAAAGITKLLHEISDAYMECVNASGDFEEGMSNVEALSGANTAEMAQLSALAKELGATTKFTALEASGAMGYMAMAGWKANEMLSGMDGVMQLAAASGEDLSIVSDIVTDSLTAFGLKASDTARFSDILAATATSANTNVAMMGDTFKYAAPLAGALGYSVEDVATMIGLMANAGIKGSQSGTALRNIFSKLTDGAVLTSDAFGEITVETQNADGSMKGLSEIISELRARFAEMTEAEKIANAEALVGERSMSGFITLMNAADGDFESLKATITDCSGAATKMADIKLDNMNGQLVLMQSAWDAVKVSIGEEFSPTMRDVYKLLTEAGNQVNEFVKAHPNVVKAIAILTVGVGGFAAALAAYKVAATVAAAATTLFANVANPAFLLIGAGIAATSAALIAFAALNRDTAEDVDELTYASKEQYYALEDLKAQYQEACDTYGETSDEALKLKEQVDEATAAFEESKQKAEDLAEAHRDVMDAYRDMASTYSENSSTIEEESSNVTSLVTKLESLMAVEQKTASTKEQILGVVDLLNEALPELSLSYDANTDSLNKSTDAVLALAKAELSRRQNESNYQELMDRLAQESALEEDLEAQHKELAEAEKELAEAEKAQSDAQEQQNKAIPLSGDAAFGAAMYMSQYTGAVNEAQEKVNALRESEEEAQKAYDENQQAIQDLSESLAGYNEEAQEAGTSATELNDSLQASMDKAQELGEAYQKAYEDAYSGISGSFGLFDQVSLEVQTSVSDMLAALDSQAEYMANYTANLQAAKDMGLSDALIAALSDGSQESAAYLQEIVNNGGDKIQELNDKFAKVEEGKDKFAETVGEMQTNFSKEMDALVSDLESTVEEMDLQEQAAQSGYNTIQGFIDAATNPTTLARVSSAYSALAQRASAAISANSGTTIPITGHYASGTQDAAPGFAEVGENGPELVFFNGGEKVLTAEETEALKSGQDIARAGNVIDFAAAAALYSSRNPESADEISVEPAGSGGGYHIVVNPVYNINAVDDGEDLETKLQRHDEKLMELLREMIEDIQDDDRRRKFS